MQFGFSRKIILVCVRGERTLAVVLCQFAKGTNLQKHVLMTTKQVSPKVVCWLLLLTGDRVAEREPRSTRFAKKPKDATAFSTIKKKPGCNLLLTHTFSTQDLFCFCTSNLSSPRIPLFWWGRVLSLCKGCNKHLLSLTDKVDNMLRLKTSI